MKLSIHRTFVSQIKKRWWFTFALFLTLLFGVPFVGGIIQNTDYTLQERLHASFGIFGLLAFWGLGLRKKFIQQTFWRVFFFIDALLFVQCMIFGRKYDLPLLWCVICYLVLVLVTVPYYIGLFVYAFRSKQIWKQQEDKRITPYITFPHYKWVRRKRLFKKLLGFLKFSAAVALIILCLTFIPVVIRNNRVIYPEGMPSEWYEHMLEYRRTTIPELQEFERLFPCYLCDFDYSESKLIIDPNDKGENIAYVDPNSPVGWRLSAGLHKRYLFVMETDIVFAQIDPKTREILSPGSHGEPTFSLWQVRSVSAPLVLFKQRRARTSRTQIRTLSIDEWKRLVDAQGDFGVLGIQLIKNQPVRNFHFAFTNND